MKQYHLKQIFLENLKYLLCSAKYS